MKKIDNVFCIIHFGDNKKYLEYEIYTILMLKKNTKYDIIYLYSINDTPNEFIKIIESYNVIVKGYNDMNITYNIEKFNSYYDHFNTLRTCNYLFALKLTNYKKICVIESDMIIMDNIDDIFNLNTPSILNYLEKDKINENNKFSLSNNELFNLSLQNNKSFVNGGVLLFSPSIYYYKKTISNLKLIIEKNCTYPNESLFLYTMKNLYNLPIKYNLSQFYIDKYIDIKIKIYHFNAKKYKALNIIKDNYINKDKNKNRKNLILYFKKTYYDPYHKLVKNKMNNII